ncbi:MAG: hypothetical protein QOE90_424 [Thermoplasmata archaeon]|nr:hypothetical protein [Thermoplasmata archaeon]
MLLVPLLVLVPSVGAASLCVGSGELCVGADAAAPGTTNADTVHLDYAISSTVAPQANAGGSFTCGLVASAGTETRAGAGCASQGLTPYAFVQNGPGTTTGPCVGANNEPTSFPFWCLSPGVYQGCAGLWWEVEGSTSVAWRDVVCPSNDFAGVCGYETAFNVGSACAGANPSGDVGGACAHVSLVNPSCSGLQVYSATCPDGSDGSQASLFVSGQETKLACASSGAAAATPHPTPGAGATLLP